MSEVMDFQLKESFRTVFPEYAKELSTAKSQAEIDRLHSRFVDECRANLIKVLGEHDLASTDTDQTAPISLASSTYETLKDATGDTIKRQLQVLLDGLERMKGMTDDDAGLVTAQMIASGALAVGLVACRATSRKLIAGAVEAAAAYYGVTVATVAVVVAIVVLVIVALLIPLIYFIEKPALTLVFLINELDQDLVFADDFNVHGKPTLMTSPIPPRVEIPDVGSYYTGGFIASSKRDDALVGTQYGFTMKYGEETLTFGVECPLTDIYVDNNCYCAFGETAEHAAKETDVKNKKSYTAAKGDLRLSIRVNSGGGSIAYYIARAYSAPSPA